MKADDYQRSSLGLLTDAARILQEIRDEVYVNEYVMYYFNYRTLETEADGGSPYKMRRITLFPDRKRNMCCTDCPPAR